MRKKLFKHGGSYAVDLPMAFVRDAGSKTVSVEIQRDRIIIAPQREPDTIEAEPEFKIFAAALLKDSMRRPGKLKDAKEVWDGEWDELLKDVPSGQD